MCSVTMALAGIGTGMQLMQQRQETAAAVSSANAQAKAAYQNAQMQSRKGEAIAEQYLQQGRQMDAKRKLVLGQQAAAAGASGIMGGVGSALDYMGVTDDAYAEDKYNLLTNQRNATFDNYLQEVNYRNQGNAYTAQAAGYRQQAKAAKQAGRMAMFGTLLSGAATLYGMSRAQAGGGTAGTTVTKTPTYVGNRPTKKGGSGYFGAQTFYGY